MVLSIKEIRRQKREAMSLEDREIMLEWQWLALTYGTSFTGCLRLKKLDASLVVKWIDDNGNLHEEVVDADQLYNEDVYNKFLAWAGYSYEIIRTEKPDKKGKIRKNVKIQATWPITFADTVDGLIAQFIEFATEVYPYKYDTENSKYLTEGKYDPGREKYAHIKDTQEGTEWLEGTLTTEGVAVIIVGRRIMEGKYAAWNVSNDDGFADPNVGLTIAHNYGMNYRRSEIARLIYGIIEASSGLLSTAEGEMQLAQDIANALSDQLCEIINGLDIDEDKKLIFQDGTEALIKDTILAKIIEARKKEREQLAQQVVNGLFEEWYQIEEKAKPSPELIERVLAQKIGSGDRFKLIKEAQEEEAAKARREKLA
jgi:hypothetical protein